MTESLSPTTVRTESGNEDCPNCGATIPLPLKKFLRLLPVPTAGLRVDSEERAARIRKENADRIRREGA